MASKLPKKKYFPEEGVYVIIPDQAKEVDAANPPFPSDIPMTSPPGEFQPLRLVINLRLVESARPESDVIEFDPPLEIRVRYYQKDIDAAKEYKAELSMGFYDGKKWNRFTEEKHKLKIDPTPPDGGWCIVSISHWGDPTIGMGR